MRALAIVLGLAAASPAFACDLGTIIESTAPASGATDVPTNAHLLVFFSHTNDWLDVSLEKVSTGTSVNASVTIRSGGNMGERLKAVSIVVPQVELEADTQYRLNIIADDIIDDDTTTDETVVLFTTGSTTDVTPPTYAGIQSAVHTHLLAGTAVDTCDEGDTRWHFDVTGAAAATDAVAYIVKRETFTMATGSTPDLVYEAAPEGMPADICLSVHAVDQAGNVDTNAAELCVPVTEESDTDTDTDADTDTDTDTDTDSDVDDTFREDTFRWEDTFYWGDDWWETGYWWDNRRGPGCHGLSYRICGPTGPGAPMMLPLLAMLLLWRRRD